MLDIIGKELGELGGPGKAVLFCEAILSGGKTVPGVEVQEAWHVATFLDKPDEPFLVCLGGSKVAGVVAERVAAWATLHKSIITGFQADTETVLARAASYTGNPLLALVGRCTLLLIAAL